MTNGCRTCRAVARRAKEDAGFQMPAWPDTQVVFEAALIRDQPRKHEITTKVFLCLSDLVVGSRVWHQESLVPPSFQNFNN